MDYKKAFVVVLATFACVATPSAFAAGASASALPPAVQPSDAASPESSAIPWGLVASSDLIVVGRLANYALKMHREDGQIEEGYVEIDVSKVLKGSFSKGLLHTEYGFSDDLIPFIKASRGAVVMAFLVGGYDGFYHGVVYQLYEPEGAGVLRLDSAESERAVEDELSREKYQVATVPALLNAQVGETRDRVDAAVDKLTSYFEFRRNQGVADLVKIGCKGVPFMALHLNDQRPLGGIMKIPGWQTDWIMTADDFKRVGPKTVGDVLPYLLLWVTSMGPPLRDEKQVDDAVRQKSYQFWLAYIANHIYQRDPGNFGVWQDQCTGLVW